jgi:hypothetical protein
MDVTSMDLVRAYEPERRHNWSLADVPEHVVLSLMTAKSVEGAFELTFRSWLGQPSAALAVQQHVRTQTPPHLTILHFLPNLVDSDLTVTTHSKETVITWDDMIVLPLDLDMCNADQAVERIIFKNPKYDVTVIPVSGDVVAQSMNTETRVN